MWVLKTQLSESLHSCNPGDHLPAEDTMISKPLKVPPPASQTTPPPSKVILILSPCVALPVLNFIKMGTMPVYPFFKKSASLTHVQACMSSILMCLALVWSLYYHGEFHRRDALRDLYPFSHWRAFGLLAVQAAVTKTSRTSLLVLITLATHGE